MEICLNKSKDLNTKQAFEFVYKLPLELLTFVAHYPTDLCKITGTYQLNTDESVDINANVILPMKWFCDRCGDEFDKNFFFEFQETIFPTEQEDGYYYEGNTINLTELINDQLVLNMPNKVLCKPDCKGICSVCGTNLNYGNCECEEERAKQNNPFAQIKDKLN